MKNKGLYKIKVLCPCICKCSHKEPKRFYGGEILKGRFEVLSMDENSICFFILSVEDFVFFEKEFISFTELEEKSSRSSS